MALYSVKKKKLWLWKALDRGTWKTISRIVGDCNAKTFRRLYEKVKRPNATYYTDYWEVYKSILPQEQHVIGKRHMVTIEQDNSNTPHYSARMTRRTKVVSKTARMVDLSIRIQEYFRSKENFEYWQNQLVSIYI